MILNISTLVIGKKYRNYCDLLLYSLNLKSDGDVNVFITHDGGYELDSSLFPKLNILLNILPESHKNFMGRKRFPFFLKNEAIKFAVKYHNDDQYFIHVDCDSFFREHPFSMIKDICEKFTDHSGLFAFKNHGFSSCPGRKPKLKGATLFDGIDYDFGVFYIHQNPNICVWFYEGFMFFKLKKNQILEFTDKWDNTISIVLENNLCFRPDSLEISYACYHTNINMHILIEYFKKYFGFLNKKRFNELFVDNVGDVYNILTMKK